MNPLKMSQALSRLVDRYIDIDLVVFLPQRFLLEPQSLMFEFPEKYGLENVVKTPKGLLEREEFVYDEKNGLPSEGAIRRNGDASKAPGRSLGAHSL